MRLPIRVALREGESASAFLSRALLAADFTIDDLRRLTRADVRWMTVSVFMAPNAIRTIAHLTDTPYGAVKQATMWRYEAGIPLLHRSLTGTENLVATARRTWLWPAATQCCPQCLHENPDVWLLEWHLPWIFDCPRHHCMLLTNCPRCSKPFRERHTCPKASNDSTIDRFWPPSAAVREVAPMHATTRAQRDTAARVRAALDGSNQRLFNAQVLGSDYLDTLRSLAGLLDHIDHAERAGIRPFKRTVAAAPRHPAKRARLLTAADRLALLDAPQAAQELASLLEGAQFEGAVRTWVRDHTKRTIALDVVLEEATLLRSSVGRSKPQPGIRLNPDHIPQLFWPQPWEALRDANRASETTARAFASMTLAKALTGMTWKQAGESIGLPAEVASQVARVGKRHLGLPDQQYLNLVIALVPAHPANYRERESTARTLLDGPDFIEMVVGRLTHRAVMPQLVAERLWHTWCLAHPALRPGPATPTTRVVRWRLANQRARWSEQDEEAVTTLMADMA